MKFKINLQPDPAAPYFTVREHLYSFNRVGTGPKDILQEIGVKFKQLFHVPDEFKLELFYRKDFSKYLGNREVWIKDDPRKGIDLMKSENISFPESAMLDLSFSFPQINSDFSDFSSFFIDPSFSLGIPGDIVFYYTRFHDELPLPDPPKIKDDQLLFVIHAVLDDYLTKGMEMLLRESNYKAAVLYQMIEESTHLKPIVTKSLRSKTMILASCEQKFSARIENLGYEIGSFQEEGSPIITLASYPTHSKELIEMFADRVVAL